MTGALVGDWEGSKIWLRDEVNVVKRTRLKSGRVVAAGACLLVCLRSASPSSARREPWELSQGTRQSRAKAGLEEHEDGGSLARTAATGVIEPP